jgi:uncharacterized cupin superfamily protein
MTKRQKRPLGDLFGLTNFGVNLTRIAPGGVSALRHAHTKQDEFVYVLEGRPTLVTDAGRRPLEPGMCAGFRAGTENAHHLVNETGEDVDAWRRGDLPRRRYRRRGRRRQVALYAQGRDALRLMVAYCAWLAI